MESEEINITRIKNQEIALFKMENEEKNEKYK